MTINLPAGLMLMSRWGILCFMVTQPALAFAHSERLVIGQHDGSWTVEFRQMALRNAIASLEKEFKVPIHYATLPDQLISVNCSGHSPPSIIKCLFNNHADMVVRTENDQAAEIWLLALDESGIADKQDGYNEQHDAAKPRETASKSTGIDSDAMLALANSQDPEVRADSIMQLAAGQMVDADKLHELLTAALNDENSQVRAQAVQGLAKREGKAAAGVLQSALLDKDEDVKLAAIDNAGDNTELLRQAMVDNNSFVSRYAAMKMLELSKKQ